jgi:hypothetical protein
VETLLDGVSLRRVGEGSSEAKSERAEATHEVALGEDPESIAPRLGPEEASEFRRLELPDGGWGFPCNALIYDNYCIYC